MAIKGIIKDIDTALGGIGKKLIEQKRLHDSKIKEENWWANEIKTFESYKKQRNSKYAKAGFSFSDKKDVINNIELDGYHIVPGAFDKELLLRIKNKLNYFILNINVSKIRLKILSDYRGN